MRVIIALLFVVACCLHTNAQLIKQEVFNNQFSIRPTTQGKYVLKDYNNQTKTNIKPVIVLNKRAGSYKPNKKLPLFCELEYQLSRLIKRRVKFGVEPIQGEY